MNKSMLVPLACALLCVAGSGIAQQASTIPPSAMNGACKKWEFNTAALKSPQLVDLLIQVDKTGTVTAVKPIVEIENTELLQASVAWAKTCKYLPARIDGEPIDGVSRQTWKMNPLPSAKPLSRGASIVDPTSCAPTANDYPVESRRNTETGVTRVKFSIDPEGRLTEFGVIKTSRSLRLDFTALIKLAGCRFQPALSAEGVPISASFEVDYVWKLE